MYSDICQRMDVTVMLPGVPRLHRDPFLRNDGVRNPISSSLVSSCDIANQYERSLINAN